MALLDKTKLALRIVTTAYDEDINDLILAAQTDLGIAGVVLPDELDPICERAIITYVKMHFGPTEDWDRLKAAYDEQKAQLVTATGYTNWGDSDAES